MNPRDHNRFDVAVVGAGVAGSSAAIWLAQSGARVVLLDGATPGRHKVCGEFLSPESRTPLETLGVWDELQRAGAQRVTRARIATTHRRGQAIALQGEGTAISRAALDVILWRRAQEVGVETRARTRVRDIEHPNDEAKREEAFALNLGETSLSARFVISATGRGSKWGRDSDKLEPEARFVGLKTHLRGVPLPRGEVAMFPFAGGYCGLVEVEQGRVNACLLAPYARLKGSSPRALWEQVREENRALRQLTRNATQEFEWLATGNVSFDRFAPSQDDILRIGDAAGYIHPLTGDGMAMALRSGELAARSIAWALKWNQTPGETALVYARMWDREFARRLKWARVLQPLFTRPGCSNAALWLSDLWPALSALATQQTRGRVSS